MSAVHSECSIEAGQYIVMSAVTVSAVHSECSIEAVQYIVVSAVHSECST